MNIVLLVRNFIKKEKKEKPLPVPDGFCPNCWGKTEYGGKFYDAVLKRKSEIDKKDPKAGWIQEYVEKNLKGIILVNQKDKLHCTNCKISYKESELN